MLKSLLLQYSYYHKSVLGVVVLFTSPPLCMYTLLRARATMSFLQKYTMHAWGLLCFKETYIGVPQPYPVMHEVTSLKLHPGAKEGWACTGNTATSC